MQFTPTQKRAAAWLAQDLPADNTELARQLRLQFTALRGMQKSAPLLAGAFTLVMMSSIGVPGLNGFAGEFLILVGSFLTRRWWAVAAGAGVILAAVYLLWAYQRVFHGEPDEDNANISDLSVREMLVMAPLLGLIVFLGVFPKPVLERMEPAVNRLVAHIEDNSDYVEPEVATIGSGGQPAVNQGGAWMVSPPRVRNVRPSQ